MVELCSLRLRPLRTAVHDCEISNFTSVVPRLVAVELRVTLPSVWRVSLVTPFAVGGYSDNCTTSVMFLTYSEPSAAVASRFWTYDVVVRSEKARLRNASARSWTAAMAATDCLLAEM